MATTIDEIRTFKHRKGQGHRAKANQGNICGKCGTSHPPRECPVWGKKCHKCGNKNHFSTQYRSKQSGAGDKWGFVLLKGWVVGGTRCTLQPLYAWLMRGFGIGMVGILIYRVLHLSLGCDSWHASYAINLVK